MEHLTFKDILAKRIREQEKTPLLAAITAPLRLDSAPYGYAHVQCNNMNKFVCNYRGVETTPQMSPILAAYELIKESTRLNVDLEAKEIEYYPEANMVPKGINLDEIAYLRDPTVRSGWLHIKVSSRKRSRAYRFVMTDGEHNFKSKIYDTPVEAIWEYHQGKIKAATAYKPEPDVATLPDLEVIEYLREGNGYKHVRKHGGKYKGQFSICGVQYSTSSYESREMAAWAVHHHLLVAPEIDDWEKANMNRGPAAMERAKATNAEYRAIKAVATEIPPELPDRIIMRRVRLPASVG